MRTHRIVRRIPWLTGAAAAAVIAVLLQAGYAIGAQEPSEANIAAGLRIYRQKADCQACHGWAGDGRKMDSQMPDGANLRTSTLDRGRIAQAIRCGRPGRSMPAFDRLAYTDGRCNEVTKADLDRIGLELFDPAATLQPREIDQLTDFLFAKIIGQGPMTREKCIEFWGEDVALCSELSR